MKLYRNWIINEVARAGEHTNERTYVLTYIRTGQSLYPLHNFVVRGDNNPKSLLNQTVTQNTVTVDTSVSFGWLVVFGLNGPLRQYFSQNRAVSPREREKEEK